ncbi:MAG: BMP family ABC transporter substrate-binding protein [Oscillospiraceae bacterium]|nr:BMP family ABC transporter substrate-binding protein [Oscillospiraceae bacterium]
MSCMKIHVKKGIPFLLVLSLLMMTVLFSACKSTPKDPNDPEETEETAEIEETPIEHKVGFIYRGFVENSPHNLIIESARGQLERNLGVETYYIEGVLVQNFMEAVDLLIDKGVTIIVSGSHTFSHVIERAASDNHDIHFISFGDSSTRMNMTNFLPLLYQPANVCGLAAAYNSESEDLGIVADNRMFNCAGVINAYIQGAKEVQMSHFNTHVNYVSSENDDEIRAAIDYLVGKGIDVIMLYTNSDYGIRYCELIGVKVVAFSGNLPELAPENYITGFYFNMDSYLTEQVRFIQNDYFIPLTTVGEMETGHVQVIRLNNNVEEGTADLTDYLYELINTSDKIFEGKITDNFGTVMVESGVVLSLNDILAIDWLDYSVGNNFFDFSTPLPTIDSTPLEIKR